MKFLQRENVIRYAPDKGGAGGGANTDPGATTTADAAGSGDGGESGEGEEEEVEIPEELQDRVNLIVQKRLARERQKHDQEVQQAKERAKQEAEEARLAEKQEWQTLATKRQETIQELEGQVQGLQEVEAKSKRYEKALRGYVSQMMEAVPEHVQGLLKGMDVADQLEWLTANLEQYQDQDGQRHRYVGPPPAPNGSGPGKVSADEKRKKSYTPRM